MGLSSNSWIEWMFHYFYIQSIQLNYNMSIYSYNNIFLFLISYELK